MPSRHWQRDLTVTASARLTPARFLGIKARCRARDDRLHHVGCSYHVIMGNGSRPSRYHLIAIALLAAAGYLLYTSIPFPYPSEESITDQLAGRFRGRRGAPGRTK